MLIKRLILSKSIKTPIYGSVQGLKDSAKENVIPNKKGFFIIGKLSGFILSIKDNIPKTTNNIPKPNFIPLTIELLKSPLKNTPIIRKDNKNPKIK